MDKMKEWIMRISILVLGLAALAWGLYMLTPNYKGVDPKSISSDLMSRSVVVPPFNQVWFFDSGQKLEVKVRQSKSDSETMTIMVDMGAVAAIPQDTPTPSSTKRAEQGEQHSQPLVPPNSQQKAEPKSEPVQPPQGPKPTKATLSGMAKLVYEKVGSEWFLVSIEPITLRINFE